MRAHARTGRADERTQRNAPIMSCVVDFAERGHGHAQRDSAGVAPSPFAASHWLRLFQSRTAPTAAAPAAAATTTVIVASPRPLNMSLIRAGCYSNVLGSRRYRRSAPAKRVSYQGQEVNQLPVFAASRHRFHVAKFAARCAAISRLVASMELQWSWHWRGASWPPERCTPLRAESQARADG